MRVRTLIALLVVVAGCGDSFGLDDTIALTAARQRWRDAEISDYLVEVRVSCFCQPVGWYRIEVQNNQVVTATPLPGYTLPYFPPLDVFPTVDDVFDQIQAQAHGDNPMLVDATYDHLLGYPHKVSLTCQEQAPDCGVTYEFKNLSPVVPVPERSVARTPN